MDSEIPVSVWIRKGEFGCSQEQLTSFPLALNATVSQLKATIQNSGVTGLTVPDMSLFHLNLPELGSDERPIVDLLWDSRHTGICTEVHMCGRFPENRTVPGEFVIYVADPGSLFFYPIYIRGSRTVGSLREGLLTQHPEPIGSDSEEELELGQTDHCRSTHQGSKGGCRCCRSMGRRGLVPHHKYVLYNVTEGRCLLQEDQTLTHYGVVAGTALAVLRKPGPSTSTCGVSSYPITVRDSTGTARVVTLNVLPCEKIGHLLVRLWLQGVVTAQAANRTLTFEGKELNVWKTVGQCNIGPHSTLELIYSPDFRKFIEQIKAVPITWECDLRHSIPDDSEPDDHEDPGSATPGGGAHKDSESAASCNADH